MKYVSTRNQSVRLRASQAIAQGLARDGGLLTPEVFPKLTPALLEDLRGKTYGQRAVAVMKLFLEDFSEEEDSFEILTDPDSFSEVRAALEEKGIPMAEAEVTMIPQTYVTLTDEDAIKNLQRTLDLLDEDDDVQNVYHNWDE